MDRGDAAGSDSEHHSEPELQSGRDDGARDLLEARVAALEARVEEQQLEIARLKQLLEEKATANGAKDRRGAVSAGRAPAAPRSTAATTRTARPATAANKPATATAAAKAATTARPRTASAAAKPGAATKPTGASAAGASAKTNAAAKPRAAPSSARRRSTEDTATDGVRYRPLVGQCFPPTTAPAPATAPPAEQLELEYVYGYRGRDARDNLRFTLDGERILYFVASVGVVYDPRTHTQRHFVEHCDDILCMALHPSQPLCATGQLDPKGGRAAYMLIWDYDRMERVQLLDNVHQRGVACVGFSTDGEWLISVGKDDSHTICVHDWRSGKLLASARTHKDAVFSMGMNPVTRTVVLAAKNLVRFVSVDSSGAKPAIKARNGVIGKAGTAQAFLSLAFSPEGLTLTGCMDGSVYAWRDNNLVAALPMHRGPVYALCFTRDGLLTGGHDGTVRLWEVREAGDEERVEARELAQAQVPGQRVRALDARSADRVVVGTVENGVLMLGNLTSCSAEGAAAAAGDEAGDGAATSAGGAQLDVLVRSHAAELWGLATHPLLPLAATADDSGTILLYHLHHHHAVGQVPLPPDFKGARAAAKGVDFSPDGSLLAVALGGGAVALYRLEGEATDMRAELVQVDTPERRTQQVRVVRFSPTGRHLAVGTHDTTVEVYEVSAAGLGACRVMSGHSASITAIDWSRDARYLRSTSADYMLLFWEAEGAQRVKYASAMRDVAWDTHTCPLGWAVQGIWPKGSDGTDVNAAARAWTSGDGTEGGRSLLATADDFGKVCLFTYPANANPAPKREFIGHSAHVTNVCFTHDDKVLLSTGGNDTAVLQWRVVS